MPPFLAPAASPPLEPGTFNYLIFKGGANKHERIRTDYHKISLEKRTDLSGAHKGNLGFFFII